MAKLTDLPAWNSLTKEEKQRLKEVHGDRLKQDYNWTGSESSISEKELKKAEEEKKKMEEDNG